MSSTNRGSTRIESDHYPTPKTAFTPLIPWIKRLDVPVWEPACGDGRLIRWMQEAGIEADGRDIVADAEFNPRNFLEDDDCLPCIVTNPPFSLAFEFCQHAVSHSRHVFLLLRLNFLASKKRAEWFRDNEPSALFVLTKRPSFTEGGTDSCDYAWFYWGDKIRGIHHL